MGVYNMIEFEGINSITLENGVFDKVLIDLDTAIVETDVNAKWEVTTVLSSDFNGSVEGGNISTDGYKVDYIKLLRCLEGKNDWEVINVFDYDKIGNQYIFTDRYIQNNAIYRYAIIPVANNSDGKMLKSDSIQTNYSNIFITDNENNIRLVYDLTLGEVNHNRPSAISEPLNSKYPIVRMSSLSYRTGKISVLPQTSESIRTGGANYSIQEEQLLRDKWIAFLNNGRAKVIRMDNGVSMLVSTTNIVESHKEFVDGIASLSFDYTEIGDINFESMLVNGLIADTVDDKTFINEWGVSLEVV